MSTTIAITKVRFLHNDVQNDTFAYFPEMNAHQIDDGVKVCYAHLGQHSTCSVQYADMCRKARPEEYESLLKELQGIGYEKLQIV